LISHLCHTPYESIYYNTILNEGAILTYLKRKGIIAPNKPTTTNHTIKELELGDHVVHQRGTSTIEGTVYSFEKDNIVVKTMAGKYVNRYPKSIRKKDSYAGGYLLDPIPGLYSDVSDLDFTSLYPSIIKSLNLGVETLIGRIVTKDNYEQYNSLEQLKKLDPEEKLHIQKLVKRSYTLKDATIAAGALIKLIEDTPSKVYDIEKHFLKEFKKYRILPTLPFEGWSECLNISCLKKIKNYEDFSNF
jgi:DNA polymerase elongation subunit (family B)